MKPETWEKTVYKYANTTDIGIRRPDGSIICRFTSLDADQRERDADQIVAIHNALPDIERAIKQAIYSEDGLDGAEGQALLKRLGLPL